MDHHGREGKENRRGNPRKRIIGRGNGGKGRKGKERTEEKG